MTIYTVSITSDTVCPWCYVGYRQLQAAISKHLKNHPGDRFSLRWHPFQLNPLVQTESVAHNSKGTRNVLAEQPADAVLERLSAAGKSAGIKFCFSYRGRSTNTLDSHRLIEFARLKAVEDESKGACVPGLRSIQTRLVEELFADYFERDRDIADHEILVAAAGRAGLYEKEVRTLLASHALAEQVALKAEQARQNGVNGVPSFVINDIFEVQGAQEPAAFVALFERLKRRAKSKV